MVKMDTHAPSYRTNYQSANATQDSPDDNYDVIYDRTNPTESSFNNTYESINTTYEQPFPVFKKERSDSDPIYYNAAADKDNFPELSPVIEERSRSEEDEPVEYRNIPADIPSGMGVTERVGTVECSLIGNLNCLSQFHKYIQCTLRIYLDNVTLALHFYIT